MTCAGITDLRSDRTDCGFYVFWQMFVAFAELQTDMVHVTSDICAEGGGIPFRNYSSFCVRVMFPEDQGSDHPIMRPFDVSLKFW